MTEAGRASVIVGAVSVPTEGTLWAALGLEVLSTAHDGAVARQPYRDPLRGLERLGLHGGTLMAAADCTAMLASVGTLAAIENRSDAAPAIPITAEFEIRFVSAATGDVLFESDVTYASGRSAIVDTVAKREDGEVVLLARSRHVLAAAAIEACNGD